MEKEVMLCRKRLTLSKEGGLFRSSILPLLGDAMTVGIIAGTTIDAKNGIVLSIAEQSITAGSGGNMANKLKSMTNKDYTAWDLNCPQIVHIRDRQKLEAVFKRKARRAMKQELKKGYLSSPAS